LPLELTPAPAQTTTTLLDIRSPASASPPNEPLLTLNDAGDLWIKGQLYDYAFQSTITLDPAKKYWTLRDASGKIVWALEAYNHTTGVSTGDLQPSDEDDPEFLDTEWNLHATTRHEATEDRWRTGTISEDSNEWDYTERVSSGM